MKLPVFFAVCGIALQSVCFAQQIPFQEDTQEQQTQRIEMAVSSIRSAYITLSRIQSLTHDDPDKASDLCFNAIKFLVNADSLLYNGKPQNP